MNNTIITRKDNKFRAFKLENSFPESPMNDIQTFINEVDNDGYTWEIQIADGWVVITAVKVLTEYIDDNTPSSEEKEE